MATTKETLHDHEDRLKEVETHLGIKPPPPKNNRWERSKEWMRANPWVAWPLAASLSLLTIFGGYWLNHHKEWWEHDVDERIRLVLNQPKGIQERLSSIQDTVNQTKTSLDDLKPFIHDVVTHQFESASKLPVATLGQRLPAIRHLVAVAQNQQITVDTKVVGRLADNLNSVKTDVPEFWPVVGELISYRSFNFNQSILDLLAKPLPDCLDTDPGPMIITGVQSPTQMTVSKPVYKDCRLILDSPEDDERLNKVIKEKYGFIVFNHCLVVYRGGQINLFLKWTGQHIRVGIFPKPNSEATTVIDTAYNGDSLNFDQCLFDFRLRGIPSESGQRVAQGLLAQNTSMIAIPLHRGTRR